MDARETSGDAESAAARADSAPAASDTQGSAAPNEPDNPPWSVAAVEVALAVVLGAGLSFGFRTLWSAAPYAAAIAAPICVCLAVGLVAIVRTRRGYPSMPLGLLLLVIFLMTILVALPAARVLDAAG